MPILAASSSVPAIGVQMPGAARLMIDIAVLEESLPFYTPGQPLGTPLALAAAAATPPTAAYRFEPASILSSLMPILAASSVPAIGVQMPALARNRDVSALQALAFAPIFVPSGPTITIPPDQLLKATWQSTLMLAPYLVTMLRA
jgi:hypothetical protein